MPKGRTTCLCFLGHAVKNCMTVIESMGRYPNILRTNVLKIEAGPLRSAFCIVRRNGYGNF